MVGYAEKEDETVSVSRPMAELISAILYYRKFCLGYESQAERASSSSSSSSLFNDAFSVSQTI
jgi:hypothetical protein